MSGYSCDEVEKKITAKSKEHSLAKNIDESIISSIDNSDDTSIEKSNQNNGRHTEDKIYFFYLYNKISYLFISVIKLYVLGTCIRLPTPLFILVNINILKILNSQIIHCINITPITKFLINIYLIS